MTNDIPFGMIYDAPFGMTRAPEPVEKENERNDRKKREKVPGEAIPFLSGMIN